MKKFTKILAEVLCILMLFTFVSCGNEKDNTVVKVGVLSGSTGIGAVKLMKDSKEGTTDGNYEITLYQTSNVSALNTDIINGTLDIAALPINAGAALFNKSNGAVQVIAANALGVLSILGTSDTQVDSIEDLKGKTIHTTGQGATPEYILKYILAENKITYEGDNPDVTIEYYADGNTAAAHISENNVAMLPEPATTVNLASKTDIKILFDVTEEWDKISDTKLIQGCIVVNKTFAENNPKAVDKFLEEYKKSTDYVNQNVDAAADLVVEFEIIAKAEIAKQSIPRCNIVCISGNDMKSDISAMLTVLFNANPQSVGGSVPGDGYYYIKK